MSLHATIRIIDGPSQLIAYADLVKAWNAASDDDSARLLVAARIPLGDAAGAEPQWLVDRARLLLPARIPLASADEI